jgi:hypothetical protein
LVLFAVEVAVEIVLAVLLGAVAVALGWCIFQVTQKRLSGTLVYFAVTLFVSAFLLFLVQPMIGKMILPRLGGTPQVWNTCMMFFQTVLLAGYAYTHNVTSRLPLKKQLITHCVMLLLPLPVLLMFGRPFYVAGFGAEGGGNPIFLTLGLLTMIVGIPFLVVSTTAPLLQRWFHNTGDPAAKDPYFLYGASNAGSILGLLLYPVGVEYFLGLDEQAWFWLVGYVILAVLVAGCAFMLLKVPAMVQLPGTHTEEEAAPEAPQPETSAETAPAPEAAAAPQPTAVTAKPPAPVARSTGIRRGGKQRGRGARQQPIGPAAAKPAAGSIQIKKQAAPEPVIPEKPFEMTPLRRLRWVGLAAVPTSLMLGLTTYISTDISPIPMLWIIPLTLYLLSFVFVFARWPVPWVGVGRNPQNLTPHKVCVIAQLVALPVLMLVIMAGGGFYIPAIQSTLLRWAAFGLVYYGPFFLTALVCHGELARDRPPAKYLTEFYLWMSVGGMVGGTFNALIAPLIPWWGLFEFPLALVIACLVRPEGKGETWLDELLGASQSPNGKQISYALDVGLPIVIMVLAWFFIASTHSADKWGWNPSGANPTSSNPNGVPALINPDEVYPSERDAYINRDMRNSLFKFWYKTVGLGGGMAYQFTKLGFLLIAFGIAIGLALAGWKRPIRLALGLGAVLLASAIYQQSADEKTLYRDRSYFGILRVLQSEDYYVDKEGHRTDLAYRYTYLMHGTTHHGLNFHYPDFADPSSAKDKDRKLPDMTRQATTYYHRYGPVGLVMERLNWFPGMKTDEKDYRMTYWADARLPASVIGAGAPMIGMTLPLPQIVSAWSEPPYATIGLGTGTMASYGRPFQHVTFYEIDEHIRDFSLPPDGSTKLMDNGDVYFNYLQNCLKRGAKLEVIMGDARLTMTKQTSLLTEKYSDNNKDSSYFLDNFALAKNRNKPVYPAKNAFTSFNRRESYYRAIEVDAFSSDAIPVHLITREAIELYIDVLAPNGVLCVHTSNRHVNLVQPVLKICEEAKWRDWTKLDSSGNPTWQTGLAWVVCKDGGAEGSRDLNEKEPALSGHFGSEYVLVARKQEYLPPYSLTDEQMKVYKEKGVWVPSYTHDQEKRYTDFGLKTIKIETRGEGQRPYGSTVDFYNPELNKDGRVNYTLRNGKTVLEQYGYIAPPGLRTWTDDYSNVLSVFRW